MKVLVNMSTIVNGGGLQAARSFIKYVINHSPSKHAYYFLLSPSLLEYISTLKDSIDFQLISTSPSLLLSFRARGLAYKAEKSFNPDIIYSFGFPSYLFFKAVEVGRYTNPWEIYPLNEAWNMLTPKEKFSRFIKSSIRLFFASRASFIETQTHDASLAISKKLKFPIGNIFVSPNVLNDEFLEYNKNISSLKLSTPTTKFSIFVLSADHKHKNLSVMPCIINSLQNFTDYDIKVFLTLPHNSLTWSSISNNASRLGIQQSIINLGPLSLEMCLHQFSISDLLFLPTLAEIFSSTFLEAMATHTPIVTTDYSFNRDVCKNAALYYDPTSNLSAVKAILSLINNPHERLRLTSNGQKLLDSHLTPKRKYDDLIDWFSSLY